VFLKKEKMPPFDFSQYEERGREALSAFLKEKINSFKAEDLVEFNFKEQGVVVGGAHLSGKIDRIVSLSGDEVEVHDYKTGKPLVDWDESEPYKKMKAYEYERQLLFYKLL
jgi:RecB family exonuclease